MSRKSLKVIFMGTPDFAAVALQALIDSDHEIICAYSQPPRPKGRGHKVQKSPVHELAESHDIPVLTPATLKGKDAQEEFAAHNADVAIVAAYGLLLPVAVLEAPKYGCLNIHASLLPRWRGASPIQHAILKGDDVSGVTIMQMDKGLDTGDMIVKGQVDITPQTTAASLHDELAEIGGTLALEVLSDLAEHGKVHVEKQNDALSCYAPLLKKSDGQINWQDKASDIDQQIRALNPWPGVWGEIQGKRFKILQAALIHDPVDGEIGEILNKNGDILCGSATVLRIVKLQPEGKKAMDFTAALNGGYIAL